MKTDVIKVKQYILSAIERDEATKECIERSNNKDNPQLVKMLTECSARIDLSLSIMRALENNDFVDLKSFTKMS